MDELCKMDCFHCPYADCINCDPPTPWESAMMAGDYEYIPTVEQVLPRKCAMCGKPIPKKYVYCEDCMKKRRAAYEKKRRERRKQERRNEAAKELRAKRKAAGLCTVCGKPIEEKWLTGTKCAECAAKARARRAKTMAVILVLCLLTPVRAMACQEMASHETHKGQVRVEKTVGRTGLMSEKNLDLLTHLVYGESGSDWCSDEMQQYVASVAVNRVTSGLFPDTLEGVIYQRGQYQCTWDGNFYKTPNERARRNAEKILRQGSRLPAEIVTQSEIRMPRVYVKVQNMYFGYRW